MWGKRHTQGGSHGAFGTDGERTAIERLPKHSTLQLIYYEAMTRNPDCEIWLMLTHFEQKNFSGTSGRISIPKENEEEDYQRFVNFSDRSYMKISGRQRINYTEAALINCFKPAYNKEFKGTFPDKKHISYSECYKLDLSGMTIELETSDIKRWLYTESKPRLNYNPVSPYWQHENFHFVNVSNQVLNGETTLKVLDRNFVSAKEFRKYNGATKMHCLLSGKAEACCVKEGMAEGERVYHITI